MGELKSGVKAKKRQSLSTEIQNSLKQEILHLQKQLEDQFVVRSALEKALTNRPLSYDPTNENSITKPAEDLIKEIAVLELEVVYLENYLLLLHCKTFEERVSFLSSLDEESKPSSVAHEWMFSDVTGNYITTKNENSVTNSSRFLSPQDSNDNPLKVAGYLSGGKTLVNSSIHRSHSTLSQHSACSFRTPRMGTLAEAVFSYHSLPLSMLERARGATSNVTSLAEHLGTSIPHDILETPNWLSEEMIKCISAIYSELAEPPLINHSFPSSPISLSSSSGDSSPQRQCDMQSTEPTKKSSSHSWLDNPFNIEGSKEFNRSYSTMIEVQWICRDSQRLRCVKHMVQNFKSLVSRLEEVDPKKLKHEEKLAFWINVHNALAMHAFLVYGIPHNNLKRISLLLKATYNVGGQSVSVDMIQNSILGCRLPRPGQATYNVGGQSVSVDMIQNSILGCRLPRPGQWLKSLFTAKTKSKIRDAQKAYAIDHPEPHLYFALCSGSHSDPVVRMYTPKSVFQELEAAKEDYIHTILRVQKEQKILLPKIVNTFVKELGLCPAGVMEIIEHFMPVSLRKSVQKHQQGKFWKTIEWIPHNFTFRYLLSIELVK